MPQLKSGRHVAISASPLFDRIEHGSDANVTYTIVAIRLSVGTPKQLRDYLTVAYFQEGEGQPPDAPAYDSGYTVGEVLEGKAGWTEDEIRELTQWMDTDPQHARWLTEQLDEINKAIRESKVWESPLWGDEDRQEHQEG
jgi:hypothetical protein